MATTHEQQQLEELDRIRTDLVTLAFRLERIDDIDVAVVIERIAEGVRDYAAELGDLIEQLKERDND